MLTELRRAAPARLRANPALWVAGLAGVILLLTILDIDHHGLLWHADRSVSNKMLDWDLRDDHTAKMWLSLLVRFGNRFYVLLVSIPVTLYLTWRARRSEFLVRYVVALVALTVAVYALKFTVTRYPPVIKVGETNRSISFPSGHLANGVLIPGLMAWSAIRAGAPVWLARALRALQVIAPLAIVVGMTLLDYHWMSDFVGGACVGVLLLLLAVLPVWTDVGRLIDRRVPRRILVRS
ncbi:MAG TPA: phosphatase PAP2 family protein [Jatrophihabitantaceae bacterium]